MSDFRIFLDEPMNSLARVDILLDTKIMSLAFIDPILDLPNQKLHMLLLWMRGIKIFIDTTLDSPAQVDTFRYFAGYGWQGFLYYL